MNTRDPVCYAEVDQQAASEHKLVSEQNNTRYYFCSAQCKNQFDRDPGLYMSRSMDWETTDTETTDNYTA